MEHSRAGLVATMQRRLPLNQNVFNGPMRSSQLMKLFEDELKDMYWAEKALTKVIPRIIKNATSPALIDALLHHLAETENHVSRVEQVFDAIDKKSVAKKCEVMEGLIVEVGQIMESCEPGAMCDVGIISVAQKIEHFEMASYGTLLLFAESLGLAEAVDLLQATLNEEIAADENLTEVAFTAISIQQRWEEADDDSEPDMIQHHHFHLA